MDKTEIERIVSSYVCDKIFFKKKKVSNDFVLLTSGEIDSISTLRLISFLEKKFSLNIKMEDFDPDNFDSINKITKFVMEKAKAQP